MHPLLLEQAYVTEDLLAGLDDLDSSFRGWVLAKRRTLCDRLLRALEKGLTRYRRDPQKESLLAEAIINLDPTHEEACRRLMHASATAGRTAQALRAYKALWDLLDEDYGMEPSAATQELVAKIKMGGYEPQSQKEQEKIRESSVRPTSLTRLQTRSFLKESPKQGCYCRCSQSTLSRSTPTDLTSPTDSVSF